MTLESLFLDANVLFSAARSRKGRASPLVSLAGKESCEILTSPHAVEEARRNVRLKYPESERELERVLALVRLVPEAGSEAYETSLSFGLPPKDAPILGAALQAGAGALVTGDARHFGHLYGEKARETRILNLADALDALLPDDCSPCNS